MAYDRLRSLFRSMLFQVVPAALAVFVAVALDPTFWGDIGIPKEVVPVLVALVGSLVRTYFPNVGNFESK